MKVAALGRTQWLYDSILACAAAGHKIVLIGTSPPEPEYSVTERDFKHLARGLRCHFFSDKNICRPEYIQTVKRSKAEVAISVNWQTLIGRNVLDQFNYGVINAHCGDLPRFRGNACPNWAILSGEEKVMLTLHLMTESLDSGAILLRREFPLRPETYIGDVYQFMSNNIPSMFAEVLRGLEDRTIIAKGQAAEPSRSLRCFPRLPRDGEVDWNRSAADLSRLVHASAEPFAGAYSFIGTEKIIFWRAHPEILPYGNLGIPGQVVERRGSEGSIAVLTGEGVLVLEEIEASDGRRGPAFNFVKSNRVRFGLDLAQTFTHLNDKITRLEKKLRQLSKKQEK